jgi:hypothetical protein
MLNFSSDCFAPATYQTVPPPIEMPPHVSAMKIAANSTGAMPLLLWGDVLQGSSQLGILVNDVLEEPT